MVNLKRTREDILKSVVNTVHRQGLMATGLSELFKISGASSGSFYNYFHSKHDLGHALIDYEWAQLQQA
ncbi:MAG: TetR/AcrR family transcriptional regulator, partial [Cyanobacteria bacterium J06635_11]